MPADEGELEEVVAGHNPELKTERRKDDGRIHIGKVVRYIYRDATVKPVATEQGHTRTADASYVPAPGPGNGVLGLAVLVPQGCDQRQAAKQSGTEKEERRAETKAHEPFCPRQGLWPGSQRATRHLSA